jgi:2-polyprenyl-3-methyl-5-hydroxy-6-metoxy-1,4-benzoquinol methylase
MASLTDDRGYNQMFSPSKTMDVRSERRCDMMISNMEITNETTIMEIGCGTGQIANFLASKTKAKVLGTDICLPFIEEAKQNYQIENLSFEVLDFNKVETFNNQKFDYIVGNGILHHLYYNLDQALIKLKELLNENGKIIFLEPNLMNPYCYLIFKYPYFRKKANLEPDEMAFTKRFIEKKLDTSGFKNKNVEFKDFLLPITPYFLVDFTIKIGGFLEKNSLAKKWAQSLMITAEKGSV